MEVIEMSPYFNSDLNLVIEKMLKIDDITIIQRVTVFDPVSLEVAPASEC